MMGIVKKHGGTMAKLPQTASWGGYSGYFQDLEVIYWEIAYAAFWKFDGNNMLIIEKQNPQKIGQDKGLSKERQTSFETKTA